MVLWLLQLPKLTVLASGCGEGSPLSFHHWQYLEDSSLIQHRLSFNHLLLINMIIIKHSYLINKIVIPIVIFIWYLQSRRVMAVFLRLFPVMLDLIILFAVIM